METRSLKHGDRIEVDVRGVRFPATVQSKAPGLIGIEPENRERYTWRFVPPRRVVRKLGTGQEAMGVSA